MSPIIRYTVGIAIPFLSVIPTVPLLNRLGVAPLGLPLGIWWLFAAIPLTSLCLAICWFGHDRHRPAEHIDPDYDSEPS